GRPLPPPPPLPRHRLLAAAGGADDLRLVPDPPRRRAGDAGREAASPWRLASPGARRPPADRLPRDPLLRLPPLPPPGRERRHPDHPPPRAARPRTQDRVRIEPVADGVFASVAEAGDVAVGNAGFVDLGGETLVFDTHMSLRAARELRDAADAHAPARTV